MASLSAEIEHEIPLFLRKYKDGRIERLMGTEIVPAGFDSVTGVQSKDVAISPEIGVSARLYLPGNATPGHKLPLLVYFHGGGFVVHTPFSPTYHDHLNLLVAEAGVIAVSVDYRLAPENPLPVCYEDSWAAVNWVASNADSDTGDQWLKDYADFKRVFFAGDSAGGNIAHNMAIRVGLNKPPGINLVGIILNHVFFWGKTPVGDETTDAGRRGHAEHLWHYVNPTTTGADDPLMNPANDPNLSGLGCSRVLVCVGEKDLLKDRGWYYLETLKKSGWGGETEFLESKGVDHVFYLMDPSCDNAVVMLKKMASFLNLH